MRGFYEVEKKTKPLTRAETLRLRAKVKEEAETAPKGYRGPTDIDEHKVIAGLRDAVAKSLTGTKVKDLKKRVSMKKLRKLADEVVEGLKAVSKKRSRK
jgi:hypothetical protein